MPDVAEQKPVELTLGDGTVVKGANMDEAFKNLAKMKEDTAAALKAAREEADRFRQESEQYGSELQRYKNPPPKDGEFNKNEYYRLLNEDPLEAQNYLDRQRFGTEDPVGAFNQMQEKVQAMYQQSLTAQFWAAHPEFPGGKDAARQMTQRVQEMTNNGHPLSGETMEMAYNQLVREEVIKPVERKAEPEERPNPSLSSGAGAITEEQMASEIRKIEQMSTDQMEAYLRSKGVLK